MGQLRHPRMVRVYRYLSQPWLMLRHASLGYRFRARSRIERFRASRSEVSYFCAIHRTGPGFTCSKFYMQDKRQACRNLQVTDEKPKDLQRAPSRKIKLRRMREAQSLSCSRVSMAQCRTTFGRQVIGE